MSRRVKALDKPPVPSKCASGWTPLRKEGYCVKQKVKRLGPGDYSDGWSAKVVTM